MTYKRISDGVAWPGAYPDSVDVLITSDTPTRTVRSHRVIPDDQEWDDALTWFMYVHGYVPDRVSTVTEYSPDQPHASETTPEGGGSVI